MRYDFALKYGSKKFFIVSNDSTEGLDGYYTTSKVHIYCTSPRDYWLQFLSTTRRHLNILNEQNLCMYGNFLSLKTYLAAFSKLFREENKFEDDLNLSTFGVTSILMHIPRIVQFSLQILLSEMF